MQHRIRILVGDMPTSLQHKLAAVISGQPDLEMVGETGCRGVALLLEVRRMAPHAVVLGSDDGELPGEISQLLGEFPDIGVVAVIAGDLPDVCLSIRRAAFGGNGRGEGLLEVIRSAVGAEMSPPDP